MIPYFQWQTIYLGPIPIQVWGLFVSAGVLCALWYSLRLARREGLSVPVIWDLALGMLLSAFVVARLVHVFGYFGGYYLSDWPQVFYFWQGGFSAAGGVIGALLFFGFYFWRLRQRVGGGVAGADFWKYLDVIACGFPLGYAIGRLGCFFIHDHPGTLSDFVLAVRYPDGARHDLGLYLALASAILFLVVLGLRRFSGRGHGAFGDRPAGFYSSIVFIGYGLMRFWLDFLRAYDLPFSDARYFGLTLAQYFGAVLVVVGIYNLILLRKRARR